MASQGKVNCTVNGRTVQVSQESTVLQAITLAGCHVPTLCHHPKFKPRGACRVCLVELKGSRGPKLVPACAAKIEEEGMAICTDSPELQEFRRSDVEFLLARHPNACMTCEVSGSCRLQSLVQEDEVLEKWPKITRGWSGNSEAAEAELHRQHLLHDHTSPSIARDMDKCIECGLCVEACGPQGQDINVIGFAERGFSQIPTTLFDTPLSQTNCISCGQCTSVCPVGAIIEQPAWHRVLDALDSRRRKTVVQVAPATRVALGEEFGMSPGTISTPKMVKSLRKLGFDFVFDTNFAADLTIMEEATELLGRLKAHASAAQSPRISSSSSYSLSSSSPAPSSSSFPDQDVEALPSLPLFTSCCPAWVNWLEINRPDLLSHLSTTKSPQQMHGAVTKRIDAILPGTKGKEEEAGLGPYVVSVMPCTAKKDEARRPGQSSDVDEVLTTRELARMIRARHIPFASLSEEGDEGDFDHPLGESTGAGTIFGASGGVMEAALRTASHLAGLPSAQIDFHALRGVNAGVKVAEIEGLGKVAVCNGIASAQRLFSTEEWREYVAIEVMSCVGGCLGGGGEPKSMDPLVLEKRMESIYKIDRHKAKRKSHENEDVKRLYAEHLGGAPNSHSAHGLLHTTFAPRRSPRNALARFLDAVDRRDAKGAAALFTSDAVWNANAGSLAPPKSKGEGMGKNEFPKIPDKVCGRAQIEQVVSLMPPAGKGKHLHRHRMALPASADDLTVIGPGGDRHQFTIVMDGRGELIRSLTRSSA